MRKMSPYILLVAMIATCKISTAQNTSAKNEFVLKGIVDGQTTGSIYMRYVNANGNSKIDSGKIVQGHFQLTGRIKHPTIAFLTTVKKRLPDDDDRIEKADGKNSLVIFLSPADMQINLKPGDFKDATFNGSAAQMEFSSFSNEQKKSGSDAERNQAFHHFLYNHPDSYVAAYLIGGTHFKLDTLRLYYDRLPADIRNADYGKEILEKIRKKEKVAVNQTAPHFSQKDKDGNKVSLKDFKGKYVLLEFWSSTSNASRIENKNLIGVYDKFASKGFSILGISVDGKKTNKIWQDVLAKDKLPWLQLAPLKTSDNPVALLYDVETIPSNFLIDPAGKIIATDISAERLHAILATDIK
jgi:peroxiredoxin